MHARQRREAIRSEHAHTAEVGRFTLSSGTMCKGKKTQDRKTKSNNIFSNLYRENGENGVLTCFDV